MDRDSPELRAAILKNVSDALAEDLGSGDLTASLLPETATARAAIVSRDDMVLAGRPWVDEVFRRLDPAVEVNWLANDGDRISASATICRMEGLTRALLSGERIALNFLQLLSGTATVTAMYSAAVAGTKAKILDTRKTIPGLRLAQKYAVRCGGGVNHRLGLHDAILIKENHILAAGSIDAAVRKARDLHPGVPLEVEVESVAELRTALKSGAERLLLDNFAHSDLRDAVQVNGQEGNPPAALEASGGMTLEEIRDVAATGVDYISVGALTKHVTAIDLSMRLT